MNVLDQRHPLARPEKQMALPTPRLSLSRSLSSHISFAFSIILVFSLGLPLSLPQSLSPACFLSHSFSPVHTHVCVCERQDAQATVICVFFLTTFESKASDGTQQLFLCHSAISNCCHGEINPPNMAATAVPASPLLSGDIYLLLCVKHLSGLNGAETAPRPTLVLLAIHLVPDLRPFPECFAWEKNQAVTSPFTLPGNSCQADKMALEKKKKKKKQTIIKQKKTATHFH